MSRKTIGHILIQIFMSVILIGCSDFFKENPKRTENFVSQINETTENSIEILGLVGVNAFSSNTNIASVEIIYGKIVILSHGAGEADIFVYDSSYNEAIIKVNVTNEGDILIIEVIKYDESQQHIFNSSIDSSIVNDYTSLGLIGISATSNPSDIVSVSLANGYVNIVSLSPGNTIVIVSNEKNHSATIETVVTNSGSIIISKIKKYSDTSNNAIKYELVSQTGYTYNTGVKVKSSEGIYTSYSYTDEKNHSGSTTQTNYNSDGTISQVYCQTWNRNAKEYSIHIEGSIYNSDGTKNCDYIGEQMHLFYDNTNIIYSTTLQNTYVYYSGPNAGETIEQPTSNTDYTITNLGTSVGSVVYKVEYSDTFYLLYKYVTDYNYSVEYYNNNELTTKYVYTSELMEGSLYVNNTQIFNGNNICTSYSTTRVKSSNNDKIIIENTVYNGQDAIDSITEFVYNKVRHPD